MNEDKPRSLAHTRISCVVPAFNEAANLGPLLQQLVPVLSQLSPQWEVLVVDDGSRDQPALTLALAPWLQQAGVRLVSLSRNFGKEAALSAGLDRARGDVVVMLDADLQHPPSQIEPMLQEWAAGADMVCAVRRERSDEALLKRWGTRLFYRVVNAGSHVPIPPNAGDFRLLDRRVVDALVALPERNRFLKGLYAWVGFKTVFVPYMPAARASGHSSFSPRRLISLALTGVTSFSNLPLRLWSALGAIVALLALAYGGYLVIEYFVVGNELPGWTTVAAGLMFFSGVQLLSIGILGEYVGRIYDEVKRRPLYFVARETGVGHIVETAAVAAPTAKDVHITRVDGAAAAAAAAVAPAAQRPAPPRA